MRDELEKKLFENFDFFDPNGSVSHTLIPFGLECSDGWFDLIWDLCDSIKKTIESKGIDNFEVIQVKEKFGGLRFYCDNSTEEIDQLIRAAENKSYVTCEVCGQPGKFRTGGWVKTLCDVHAKDS